MVSRRGFCLSAAALPLLAAPSPDLGILVTGDEAKRVRARVGDSRERIARMVDGALKAGPWSVTSTRPKNPLPRPNDYYSEGRYWWPDPQNPTGPYIRKDGEAYPGRFTANHEALGSMCRATLALGMGAYLLDDRRCADHAARVLSTWFVAPATRMNPNLEFGQGVPGRNTGRGSGIIDTVSLIHAAQGIALLDSAGALDRALGDGVRNWFAGYTNWLTTSKKGLDEKKSGNNHSTWWTAQVATYATLTGDDATLKMAWDWYDRFLLAEIEPDGSCPKEEARTNSLGYSAMNLDAFAVLLRIARTNGVRLRTPKVERAFLYLLPYIERPERWTKQQISKFSPDGTVFPGLGGVEVGSEAMLKVYRTLARSRSPWIDWVDLVVRASS